MISTYPTTADMLTLFKINNEKILTFTKNPGVNGTPIKLKKNNMVDNLVKKLWL